ncbi:MAG: stage V sporulation protein AC [Eubacteriales bacterium]|nr:stage V sporulation protein AC [Eubacteriales bacterium]
MAKKKPQSAQAQAYQQRVNQEAPKSQTGLQCLRAFWVGGVICCIGQGIQDMARTLWGLDEKGVAAATAIILVFLGSTLTGFGVYDRLGAYAGAGSAVPITGFANSIVAPAMEFKREGYVMGVGAKLFTLAGPVLVFGVSASIVVGLLACWLGA